MTSSISIGGSPVAVGERVVYPNGGICRVKGIEKKQIAGRDWVMLMLEREEDQATVMVPQEKVGAIGLRKVATGDAIAVLFDFFTHSSADPELDWKVRHRENFEKMAAGGLLDTAQVLKGLHALAQIRPLPTKEREMYDSARHQLIGEIAAGLNLPPAVAENNIDYALTPPPGSGRTAPKDAPLDIKALRRSMGGSRRVGTGSVDDLDLGEEEEDPLLGGAAAEGEGEEGEGKEEEGEGKEEGEEEHVPVAAKAAPVKAKPAKVEKPKPAKIEAAPKPAAKAEAKPIAKVEAKPVAKVEAKPVAKIEPAPAPKPEPVLPKPIAATPALPPVPVKPVPVKAAEKVVEKVIEKPIAAKTVEKPAPAKPAKAAEKAAPKAPPAKTPAKPAAKKVEAKKAAPAKKAAAKKTPDKKAPVKKSETKPAAKVAKKGAKK